MMTLAKRLCCGLLALASFGVAQAQEAFVGSWVLDAAAGKNAVAALAPTAGTLEISNAGDGKFTSVSEVTVGGMTGRSEATYALDGNEYPIATTPAQPGVALTQAMQRVSDTVCNSSVKLNGQAIATAVTELSADGKTLTQTTTGLGQFAALSSTVVFRRK
jgi:hypothetical protein